MDKFTLDVNYNLDYLVIAPKKTANLFEDLVFTFKNVMFFNNTVQDTEFLIKFLRKNVIGRLIFVDYYAEYEEIINTLVEEHEIGFIFTRSLSELSDPIVLDEFNIICEKYDKKVVSEIGFLDRNLYDVVHLRRRNTKRILLDVSRAGSERKNGENTIGLLNRGDSNYDSFYNEMSALSFLPECKVKVFNPSDVVKKFADEFGIKLVKVEKEDELVCGNFCNLYVNFASTLPTVFIKSMDMGIPCIVGNNDFLKGYPILKEYLEVKSDDDVNEICDKIVSVKKNSRLIFKEYSKFRREYSKLAKESVEEFLEKKIEWENKKEYEKLLTVVVPVWNTEKYVARCLDSIIAAQIPGMEVLVINDDSPDDSEKIIKKYVERYPELIRYIKKKNGGLGSVRNVGLEEAKGKYLASVDSDDTIESEFFRQALKYMRKDIDIIICDWMSVSGNGSFETPAIDGIFKDRKEFVGLMYTTIMPSTCNKIMKSEIFRRNKIWYLEQKQYEDLSANPIALLNAQTVKYLKKPYYNYYLSENSLMRSKVDPRQMVNVLALLDPKITKIGMILGINEFKYYTYSWRIEEYILNPLYELNGKELTSAINYIYKHLYKIMIDVFDSSYYRKMLDELKTEETRDFINARNRAIKVKKLEEFLKLKAKNLRKLNAGIIYYGE